MKTKEQTVNELKQLVERLKHEKHMFIENIIRPSGLKFDAQVTRFDQLITSLELRIQGIYIEMGLEK